MPNTSKGRRGEGLLEVGGWVGGSEVGRGTGKVEGEETVVQIIKKKRNEAAGETAPREEHVLALQKTWAQFPDSSREVHTCQHQGTLF